uniref:Uncharacterized protein n=1 Tax=Rhizophora mucronata TaxID=61149 RepID=A0A2P2NXL5_RHIMU
MKLPHLNLHYVSSNS